MPRRKVLLPLSNTVVDVGRTGVHGAYIHSGKIHLRGENVRKGEVGIKGHF